MKSFCQRDWSQEQLVDPVYSATMAYVGRAYPAPFLLDVLREALGSFFVRPSPSRDEVLELASSVTLVNVTIDTGDTLAILVREPTHRNDRPTLRVASLLNDKHTRFLLESFYAP